MTFLLNQKHAIGLLMTMALTPVAQAMSCTSQTSGYVVNSQVIYFEQDLTKQPQRVEKMVRQADPASFEVVRQKKPLSPQGGLCDGRKIDHGRDKSHVYFRASIIATADAKTFEFLDDRYARDAQAIFSNGKKISTRVASFSRVGPYATDGKKHFFGDIVIEGSGFKLLGGDGNSERGYASTTSRVYHDGRWIKRADARTFEVYKPEVGITRDKRFVYFNDAVIAGADPQTFEQINGYTFKDKVGVYVEGKKINGARPAQARVSEFGSYVMDDQSVFKDGKLLGQRDAASFLELQPPWSKDKNAVYYRDEVAPGIDAPSFKATSLDRGEDRNYGYNGLRRVCKVGGVEGQLPACN